MADYYRQGAASAQRSGGHGVGGGVISDKRPVAFTVHFEDGSTAHMNPAEHEKFLAASQRFRVEMSGHGRTM